MNAATARWGLPDDFVPVRYPVSDGVKEAVRAQLEASEPVIVSLANEGDSVSVIGTPQRLIAVRSGAVNAGVTGFAVRALPWESITKMVLQQVSLNVKYAITFRSIDGRTPEVGRRAAMGRDIVENLMPFETAAGSEAFNALKSIWQHKTQSV